MERGDGGGDGALDGVDLLLELVDIHNLTDGPGEKDLGARDLDLIPRGPDCGLRR